MTKSRAEARAIKQRLVRELAGDHDVVGIGLVPLQDSWAVKINLARELATRQFPQAIDGVAVLTEVVGQIDSL